MVDKNTDDFKLELKFLDMLERNDIAIILITKEAAVKLSHVLKHYKGIDPTVMVSKLLLSLNLFSHPALA